MRYARTSILPMFLDTESTVCAKQSRATKCSRSEIHVKLYLNPPVSGLSSYCFPHLNPNFFSKDQHHVVILRITENIYSESLSDEHLISQKRMSELYLICSVMDLELLFT